MLIVLTVTSELTRARRHCVTHIPAPFSNLHKIYFGLYSIYMKNIINATYFYFWFMTRETRVALVYVK